MAEKQTTVEQLPNDGADELSQILLKQFAKRNLRTPADFKQKMRSIFAPYFAAIGMALAAPSVEQTPPEQAAVAAAEQAMNTFGNPEEFLEESAPIEPGDLEIDAEIPENSTTTIVRPSDNATITESGTPVAPPTPSPEPESSDTNLQTKDSESNTTINEPAPPTPGNFDEAGSPVVAPDDTLSSGEEIATPAAEQGPREQPQPSTNAPQREASRPTDQPKPPRKTQAQITALNNAIDRLAKIIAGQKKKLKPLERPIKGLMYTHRLLNGATIFLIIVGLILGATIVFAPAAIPFFGLAFTAWRAGRALKHRLSKVEEKIEPKKKRIAKLEESLQNKKKERDSLMKGESLKKKVENTKSATAA